MPTRIKICGITSCDDAILAAQAGVDAIGLNFYDKGPRCVDLTTAREIAKTVGPFVNVLGLFVDAGAEWVNAVLDVVPLHGLQFHGQELPDYCAQFNRPYLKALRVRAAHTRIDVERMMEPFQNASGILLDTYSNVAAGGTGETFNWGSIPASSAAQIVLAGGLTAANVANAIATVKPYAVDVSSGVEFAPGKKDRNKVTQFMEQVRAASNRFN